MDLGLAGRVAIVSGASRGLGKATAMALASEGARLAICARGEQTLRATAAEIRSTTGSDVLAAPADVADPDAVRDFVEQVKDRYDGRIDILVTNAGGPPAGTAEAILPEQWHRAFGQTFMSVVTFCRQVVPIMKARRWGRVVNIASISVKQPIAGLAISNALRAAVVGFAKTLASEVAGANVLVNTVCPGFIATDRTHELLAAWAQQRGVSEAEILRERTAEIPAGRTGKPEELAAVIAFLCSEPAAYLAGVTVQVDGGACRGLL